MPLGVCAPAHCTDVNNDCCASEQFNEPATCEPGYTARRTGDCYGFKNGAFECCSDGPPSASLARMLEAFEAHGLLIHGLHGTSKVMPYLAVAKTLDEVVVADTDCGERCMAFSYWDPTLPVH